MNILRRVFSSRNLSLAAVVALCLSERPATAQIGPAGPGNNYYPHTDAPINGSHALTLIETLLHEQHVKVKDAAGTPTVPGQTVFRVRVPSLYLPPSGTTPALPPIPGDDNKSDFPTASDFYVIASDTELDIALGAAVQKFLDGTMSLIDVDPVTPGVQPFGGTIGDLVSAVSLYRKKAVSKIVVTTTNNILNWGGFANEAARTAALEAVVEAAATAEPAEAHNVVGAMLKVVVPKVAGATPNSPLPLGAAQTARTPAAPTPATLATALNSLPDIARKGGVRTEVNGANIRVHFGSTFVDIPNGSTAGDITSLLNNAGFGLSTYGVFAVALDSANAVPAFQDDFVFVYKPINLNLAGALKWNVTPAFSGTSAQFDGAADDIFLVAMEVASVNGAKIVDKALAVVMQGVDVSGNSGNSPLVNGTLDRAKQRAKDIAGIAITTAYTYGNGYLADEIGVAIGKRAKAVSWQHKASDPLNKKNAVITSAEIVEAIFEYPGAPTDIKEIALIGAGLMKGFQGSLFEAPVVNANIQQASANRPEVNITQGIKDTVGSLTVADETYLDNVQFGFASAYPAGTNAISVAQAVLTGMAGGDSNELAARIVGGAAWQPGIIGAKSLLFPKGSFVAEVLQLDADDSGDDTISQIIEAAVRGSSKDVAKVTEFAAAWSKNATTSGTLETERFGQIGEGAALGLKGQPNYNTLLNTAVGKIMTAAPVTKVLTNTTIAPSGPHAGQPLKSALKLTEFDTAGRTQLTEVMSYTAAATATAGHPTAAAGVALALAKSVKSFYEFYEPIIEGMIAAFPDSDEQWRAVLGVMAVNKLGTLEHDGTFNNLDPMNGKVLAGMQQLAARIPDFAGTVVDYDTDNDLPIEKGGAVIKNIQDFPKAVFNKAFDAFADNDVVTHIDERLASAVLNGVGLVSSKSASIAAALAVKFRPADAADFQTEAIGLNPVAAPGIKLSVATASHVAAGTGDLFDYLNNQILQNTKFLVDIVGAATIVAPGYAHIVAHAVGFTTPKDVSKVAAALFQYSHIVSADALVSSPLEGEYDNRVDAAAAISAAVTAGIVEAKTGSDFASLRTKPVIDVTLATKAQKTEITNLKNAVVAMVKQVLTITGNTPVLSPWLPGTNPDLGNFNGDSLPGGGEGPNNFLQSDGSTPILGVNPGISNVFASGYTQQKQTGPAGVISGYISQVIADGNTRLPLGTPAFASGDLGPVGQVLTAAAAVVKSDPSKILAIAQAAAQAARGVSSTFSSGGSESIPGPGGVTASGLGEKDIVLAILNALVKSGLAITTPGHPEYVGNLTLANGKPNPFYLMHERVANAVHFGVLAAQNNIPAAGAAGVINFAHQTLTGNPVTDIFGL